jgi:hypothetical protein
MRLSGNNQAKSLTPPEPALRGFLDSEHLPELRHHHPVNSPSRFSTVERRPQATTGKRTSSLYQMH